MAKRNNNATTTTNDNANAGTSHEATPPEAKADPLKAVSAEVDMGNPMNPTLVLTFGTGNTLEFQPSMTTPEIATMAMMHGFKQKLVDAAAISRNPDTGKSATFADKEAAVREVYDRLVNGQWNKAREGGDGGMGLFVAALVRLYPAKGLDGVKAFLEPMSDEQITALKRNPKVAATMAEIRAERAGANQINSDELLSGLNG